MKPTFSARSTPTPSTNRDIFTRDLAGELAEHCRRIYPNRTELFCHFPTDILHRNK